MWAWLFGKKLSDVINQTKKVKVVGVTFTIRKVNILDYAAGSKVLIQAYDTHKTAGAKIEALQATGEKAKRHYADILVAGVVDPVITHDGKDGTINVNDMMPNWELTERLYAEIMTFTYGKKKLKQAMLAVKNSSS